MSAIFDLLYREYCRARLAEMRKQLLIPVAGHAMLEAHRVGGDPAALSLTVGTAKEAQPSHSRDP
jgi:hypothetical protein